MIVTIARAKHHFTADIMHDSSACRSVSPLCDCWSCRMFCTVTSCMVR